MTPMFSRAGPFGFFVALCSLLLVGDRPYPATPRSPIGFTDRWRRFHYGSMRGLGWRLRHGMRSITETIIRSGNGDCRHRRGLGRHLVLA